MSKHKASEFKVSKGKELTMEDRFMGNVPKPIQIGDEIIIKGKIVDYINQIAFSLIVDHWVNNAYCLATIFKPRNIMQHLYQTDGKWHRIAESPNTWTDGPGTEFVLTFHFGDTELLVYAGDENRQLLHKFKYQFDIAAIKFVEVFMCYTREIIFRYAKPE